MAHCARTFLDAYEHTSSDAQYNGEYDLLHRLATKDDIVVIDCGANVGSWTIEARNHFPEATIHAFEPIPSTAATMRSIVGGDARVFVHDCALSDFPGMASMMLNDTDSTTASLTNRPTLPGLRSVDVTLLTGDQFLTQEGIDRIYLLKVDAEGHDLAVLRGFEHALENHRIDTIQFEISGWNAVTRTWIGEFYDLLNGHGYEVGRITPGGVDLLPYDPAIEDFSRTGNFTAVRRDDLANAVRVSGKGRR